MNLQDTLVLMIAFVSTTATITGCQRQSPPPAAQQPVTSSLSNRRDASRNSAQHNKLSAFHFTDRTASAGIEFTYRNGEEAGHVSILEMLGGGVAVLDFDRDSHEDLYFAGGGGYDDARQIRGVSGGLSRNLGGWGFEDVTKPALLNKPRQYSHGASSADYNGDGFPDILVTGYGGLQLWRNQGDGTFSEATAMAGLNDTLWSSSAAWGDLNNDGSLDLFVAHYVNWSFDNHPFCNGPRPELREYCPPRDFQPLRDALYVSNGDGSFRDGTDSYSLREDGKGLGVILCDLDLDGDLDAYVTNDGDGNHLYENNGQGGFCDVSLLSGTALSDRGVPNGSMGVDVFDYNLDGLPDLWVANYEQENCGLYQNTGRLLFRHVSQQTGVTAVGGMFVGWGTCCFDIDRDGDEDVFVANGHVILYSDNAPVKQPSLLFENLAGRRFRNVAPDSGQYASSPHAGRGAATSDLDGDGDLDLVVSHLNSPVTVLENDSKSHGGWLAVDLVGTISSRDAIGAIVRVTTDSASQVRQWKGGGSYASTSTRQLFFGLGSATQVREIEVRWPSGIRQVIVATPMNQVLHVIERQVF